MIGRLIAAAVPPPDSNALTLGEGMVPVEFLAAVEDLAIDRIDALVPAGIEVETIVPPAIVLRDHADAARTRAALVRQIVAAVVAEDETRQEVPGECLRTHDDAGVQLSDQDANDRERGTLLHPAAAAAVAASLIVSMAANGASVSPTAARAPVAPREIVPTPDAAPPARVVTASAPWADAITRVYAAPPSGRDTLLPAAGAAALNATDASATAQDAAPNLATAPVGETASAFGGQPAAATPHTDMAASQWQGSEPPPGGNGRPQALLTETAALGSGTRSVHPGAADEPRTSTLIAVADPRADATSVTAGRRHGNPAMEDGDTHAPDAHRSGAADEPTLNPAAADGSPPRLSEATRVFEAVARRGDNEARTEDAPAPRATAFEGDRRPAYEPTGQLRLDVRVPDLGDVLVRLRSRGNEVAAAVVTESASAARAIAAEVNGLHAALASQGVALAGMDVNGSPAQFASDAWPDADAASGAAPQPAPAAPAHAHGAPSRDSGLDYRV